MNLKIPLAVLFAFFITFTLFYFLYEKTPNLDSKENIDKFFTQTFDNTNKILLIGSSHVGEMNSTFVNEQVSNKNSNFVVYNLSYNEDNPTKRIQFVDKMIELKPSIVFYGISYSDLQISKSNEKEDPLPNLKQFFDPMLNDGIDPDPINPKLITLHAIRNLFQNSNLFPDSETFYQFYSPFMTFYTYNTIINRDIQYSSTVQPFSLSNIENFYKIIQKLEENNIQVVIFTPPHHRSYLENIPISQQQLLTSLILNTTNNFELNFYNFTDRYQDLEIWRNPTHVAYNIESLIYSDDVASMINLEIER